MKVDAASSALLLNLYHQWGSYLLCETTTKVLDCQRILYYRIWCLIPNLHSPQDTLRSSCDNSINCTTNCCVSRYVAPLFFVSFVLFAQFVLVNIVIAVLMKHLRVTRKSKKRRGKKSSKTRNSGSRNKETNLNPITFLRRKWGKWKRGVSFDDDIFCWCFWPFKPTREIL